MKRCFFAYILLFSLVLLNLSCAQATWTISVISDKDLYSKGEQAHFNIEIKRDGHWVNENVVDVEASFPFEDTLITFTQIEIGRFIYEVILDDFPQYQTLRVRIFSKNRNKKIGQIEKHIQVFQEKVKKLEENKPNKYIELIKDFEEKIDILEEKKQELNTPLTEGEKTIEVTPSGSNINYLISTSNPKIFCEHSLDDGKNGTINIALIRSYYDPNASPPTNYTVLVNPDDQYAIDNVKAYDNGQWYRLMSDSNNIMAGIADGYEDGLGNASSLYDNAMTVISLTAAGETIKARKIMDGFKKTVFILFDDDSTGAVHPGGSYQNPIKDQGEDMTVFSSMLLAASFDVWKESSEPNDEYFQYDEDTRLNDYPRMAPGHEYGIWLNQPETPSWAGVDDHIDSPRVSEKDDIEDKNDEGIEDFAPYLEDEYYHRTFFPYTLFFQWYNCDTPVNTGTESAQKIETDRLLPYSSHLKQEEYKYKDFQPSVGDNLWMCIAMLYYTHKENDSQYLPVVYKILDTIVDNLQDFNGGIHFGYYGAHEITATATEHVIDFAFAWHWIDKLYDNGNGPVSYEHWNRYKKAMDGTITLSNNDIAILDINTGAYSTNDDNAVKGAHYMLKFLAIPHTIIEIAYDAVSLNLPVSCDVLILPETPYQYLSTSFKNAINDFAENGGAIFATGRAAVNIGETKNPFGVKFAGMQEIGGTTGIKNPITYSARNIVISKIYKDGIDNPSTAIDFNLNQTLDSNEANTEPSEIDNWEEGLGNLLFAYKALEPYSYFLIWSFPDFKKSRLTYFLADIGDRWHALNGGKTPNLDPDLNPEDKDERTDNEGNSITIKYYAKDPTIYTANEWGHISMILAKVDINGIENMNDEYNYSEEIEMLYFNEPSNGTNKGKVIYFAGDMFGFFYDCINHNTVDNVKLSPYKYGYYNAFSTHAQILENSLQWFFTDGLDPIYTSRDPYGSNTVYSEHWAGEIGHYSAVHNKFGSDSQNPGKSIIAVTLDNNNTPWSGNKNIKIVKDNTETYAGIWLTKNIDFGDFSSMTAGKHGGAYTGAILSGATSLTLYAKADSPTNVEFGFGIEDPNNDSDKEDSDHDSINVSLGTEWTKYTINTSDNNMSHINGVFYAKIISSVGTIYIDNIHYNPRAYGYNDEAIEGTRTIYREGNSNEGIWSGWMGENNGSSLTVHGEKKSADDPYSGYYCLKITKDSSESWAGIWVQELGGDPSEAVRWSYGEGVGANLTGATKLTFWAKSDSSEGRRVKFGYGYGTPGNPEDSSSTWLYAYGSPYVPKVTNEWQKYEINLTGKDMLHVNGLFFFSTNESTMTLYLDNIQYEPVGNDLVPTYQQDLEAGNLEPYLWRKKNLAHLGVTHYLENAVWADSDSYLRLPMGCFESSRLELEFNGEIYPEDLVYEMDHLLTGEFENLWVTPENWTRKKMFIRGQLDFVKAADLCTWGAVYWLDKPTPNTTNANELLALTEDIFITTVSKGETAVTSMEYWDVPDNDLVNAGDDFGESVWPEGIGQLIQAAYLAGDNELAVKHIFEMQKIEYDFGNGKKAYPYSWPVNMIIDTAGAGWGDDEERIDSLSIAATTWMYLGKNKKSCFANAEMP